MFFYTGHILVPLKPNRDNEISIARMSYRKESRPVFFWFCMSSSFVALTWFSPVRLSMFNSLQSKRPCATQSSIIARLQSSVVYFHEYVHSLSFISLDASLLLLLYPNGLVDADAPEEPNGLVCCGAPPYCGTGA